MPKKEKKDILPIKQPDKTYVSYLEYVEQLRNKIYGDKINPIFK